MSERNCIENIKLHFNFYQINISRNNSAIKVESTVTFETRSVVPQIQVRWSLWRLAGLICRAGIAIKSNKNWHERIICRLRVLSRQINGHWTWTTPLPTPRPRSNSLLYPPLQSSHHLFDNRSPTFHIYNRGSPKFYSLGKPSKKIKSFNKEKFLIS